MLSGCHAISIHIYTHAHHHLILEHTLLIHAESRLVVCEIEKQIQRVYSTLHMQATGKIKPE